MKVGTCSLICQGIYSTKRQRKDLFGLRVKLPPVTTSLTTQRRRQSRFLPKDTTSELAGFFSTLSSL